MLLIGGMEASFLCVVLVVWYGGVRRRRDVCEVDRNVERMFRWRLRLRLTGDVDVDRIVE